MMGPPFAAELGKFSRQSLDPAMPFPVPPGIISRHAHECGDFFRCPLLFAQSVDLLLDTLDCWLNFFPFDVRHYAL